MSKSIAKLLVLALTLALVFTGCSKSKATTSSGAYGGTLRFGLNSEPTSLDPAKAAQTTAREVKECIYRGLYNFDTGGKPAPQLATGYTMSSDGLTYTFKLRDAKFQNGDQVTAEDVKFTFSRAMDPKNAEVDQALLNNMISSVNVVDSKTVSFTLKKPNSAFIDYVSLPEMGIVSESWTNAHNGDLNNYPMGAGPFKFVSWTKGQSIVVKKSSNYYENGKPYLDEIDFSFYSDDNARINALYGSTADIVDYVPYSMAAPVKYNPSYKLVSSNGPFAELQFNVKNKPFDDPKVRQAFGYAINRQVVIDEAYMGQGSPIWGAPIHQGALGYDSKLDNYYSYDVTKAKQLLSEAGYPNGFSFTLDTSSTYSYQQATAIAVQAELKKIGVTATLRSSDWATRMSLFSASNFACMVDTTEGDIGTDPEWLRQFVGKGGGNNKGLFDDPQIDSLLDQGVATADTTQRNSIYKQLNQQVLTDSPYIYLCYKSQMWAMTKKVNGFTALPTVEYQSGITLEDTYLSK